MKSAIYFVLAGGIILFLLLEGCYSSNQVSVQNLSDQYESQHDYLHPQFTIYHVNDSLSRIYYKIDLSDLLYLRRNMSDSFSAKVNIFCKISYSYHSAQEIDSASALLTFTSSSNTIKDFANGSFPIRLKAGNDYLLTVTTTDLMSRKENTAYLTVEKTNEYDAQNFLVRKLPSHTVLTHDYTDSSEPLSITYNRPVSKLFVNYYRRQFPIAAPPFSETELQPFRFRSDSVFDITPDSSGAFRITAPPAGYYHIQADTSNHEGLTIYRYPKYFPEVGEAYQMAAPLRYITSTPEYTGITQSANVKKAVESFWLNITNGNQDRARDLIRTYYNRVEEANRYFTSYLEGWKTDRGMIFIIFGAPGTVYRTSNSETWTYGEDKNYMSISFTFVRTANPFTANDYSLQRSQQFRNVWYNSVDVWRQGRVY